MVRLPTRLSVCLRISGRRSKLENASRTRARLPHEVHTAIFDWVLALIAEAGLVKGERIGVDASTMEANAALRNIVRRDTGEGYRGSRQDLHRAILSQAATSALSPTTDISGARPNVCL